MPSKFTLNAHTFTVINMHSANEKVSTGENFQEVIDTAKYAKSIDYLGLFRVTISLRNAQKLNVLTRHGLKKETVIKKQLAF